jgi:hypothetical protein
MEIVFIIKVLLWIAWCCFSGFVLGRTVSKKRLGWLVFVPAIILLSAANIFVWLFYLAV